VIACSIPFLEVSQEVSLIIYGVVALLCIVVLWRSAATALPGRARRDPNLGEPPREHVAASAISGLH
jgi:hypothetical protein